MVVTPSLVPKSLGGRRLKIGEGRDRAVPRKHVPLVGSSCTRYTSSRSGRYVPCGAPTRVVIINNAGTLGSVTGGPCVSPQTFLRSWNVF